MKNAINWVLSGFGCGMILFVLYFTVKGASHSFIAPVNADQVEVYSTPDDLRFEPPKLTPHK